MSTITAEDVDGFVNHLATKPCGGSKSYNKDVADVPLLASSTIKKCFTILSSGFETAKAWKYIAEAPKTSAPIEKWAKRKAWEPNAEKKCIYADVKKPVLVNENKKLCGLPHSSKHRKPHN